MSTPTLLGKAELLEWAAGVTGITPCEKYGDLKDGLIYLALARELFPQDIDSAIVRLQRRGARDPSKNWSLLTSCLRRHGIPLHLCNRQAVERGHTRHCFNLLVLFYFLLRLSSGDQFSADFAQPVDPQLAAFLQSPESVAAIDRAAVICAAASEGNPDKSKVGQAAVDERNVGEGVWNSGRVVTRLSSPPSASTFPHSMRQHPPLSSCPDVVSSQVSLNSAATHASRFVSNERNPVEDASPSLWSSRGVHLHKALTNGLGYSYEKDPRATLTTANSSHKWGISPPSGPSHCGPSTTTKYDENREALVDAASPVLPPSSSLQITNQLLREELQYVKAVSQLLVTQQRGSAAAAEMRAAATLQSELAKAELDHLHDLRQLEVTLTASSSSPSPSVYNRQANDLQWAALEHRAEVAEKTAAQLYEKLNESHITYDATLQQLQQVFRTIDSITEGAVAQPAVSSISFSAHIGTAAYEEAAANAIMAQLECVPAVLRDAFRMQLRALLLTLNALRVQNERLRVDMQNATDSSGMRRNSASSVSGHRAVSAAAASSSPQLSSTPQGVAALCEGARYVCQTANPAVQQACHELTQLVKELQSQLEDAQHDAEESQLRCRQMEKIAASAETALQRARATHAARRMHDPGEDFTTSRIQDSTTQLLSSQQHGEQMEKALQEVQRLYDRVAEVLMRIFSTPGTEDMRWANEQLVSALDAFLQRKQLTGALESALTEQREIIAALRNEVRQRGETPDRVKADLETSERQRCELEQRCATLEQQLRDQNERPSEKKFIAAAQVSSGQRAWLGRTSPSVASAPSSKGPFSPSPRQVRANASQLTPSQRVISSYQPGAFRSPSVSSAEDENQARKCPSSFNDEDRSENTHPDRSQAQLPLSAQSQMPATTALNSQQRSLTSLSKAAAIPILTVASAEAPSPLLSAAELERRKEAILRKFNVE